MLPTNNRDDETIQSQPKVYSILLVDDDPTTSEETKNYLDRKGYLAKIVQNGGQAHSQLRIEKADVVILKLILPDESGFEICERIKREFPWTPVLIWTEITLEASRRLAAHVQADGYLTRPCDLELLEETMNKVTKVVWERYEKSKLDGNSSEESDRNRYAISSELSDDEIESESSTSDVNSPSKKPQSIRFRCKCGKELRTKLKNQGRFIYCNRCKDRVRVPDFNEQSFIDDAVSTDEELTKGSDPLKFVSIRCQNCLTLFRLYSTKLTTNPICPRCAHPQTGALSIKGIPLSQAALASSMRLLRICTGENTGKKLLLPENKIVLGKGKKAKLRFQDPEIEDLHCILKPVANGILVKDLESATGTWINEKKIEGQALLPPRGLLQVGSVILRLLSKNRSTADAMKRIQNWSIEEEEASKNSEQIFRHNISIPTEAAAVIEMHWDYFRKQRMKQQANDSVED